MFAYLSFVIDLFKSLLISILDKLRFLEQFKDFLINDFENFLESIFGVGIA